MREGNNTQTSKTSNPSSPPPRGGYRRSLNQKLLNLKL